MAKLLSFSVVGEREVLQHLTAIGTRTKDLRPWWRDVFAPRYLASVQDLFRTGGRARGGGGRFKSGAWARLSPTYREWKARHYPGRPILVRDGRLRDSLTWRGTDIADGGVFESRRDSVVIGTSVPYGRHHMTGTSRMPARPFLPPFDMAAYGPLLQQWLLRGRKGVGA